MELDGGYRSSVVREVGYHPTCTEIPHLGGREGGRRGDKEEGREEGRGERKERREMGKREGRHWMRGR